MNILIAESDVHLIPLPPSLKEVEPDIHVSKSFSRLAVGYLLEF